MTKLLYAASAAAILTVAGYMPAMAQSSASSPMITCRDLSSMDRETARGVVFYMSGFRAASGSQSASSSGTTGTDTTGSGSSTTGSSGSTSADAGSGASGSTTGSSGSTDTTGSTTAAGGASGSSDTSGTSASGSASGSGGGASSAMVAQLPGFSGIDVDKIMADCASSPDKQLSDMMGSSQ